MWCGETFKSNSGPLDTHQHTCRHTHSYTQAIRCFMWLWIWHYIFIPPGVSRCACTSISLGFLDSTSSLVQSQEALHKSQWDLQQGSWSTDSWENSKSVHPHHKPQASGEPWELCWGSVVLLFLWWVLMLNICTYVEHRQHLVRQEVGNTHDGLSVRKPFLYSLQTWYST